MRGPRRPFTFPAFTTRRTLHKRKHLTKLQRSGHRCRPLYPDSRAAGLALLHRRMEKAEAVGAHSFSPNFISSRPVRVCSESNAVLSSMCRRRTSLRTRGGYASIRTALPIGETTGPWVAEWNHRIAFGLTHRRFAASLIVQADRQVPSITTRVPALFAAAIAMI